MMLGFLTAWPAPAGVKAAAHIDTPKPDDSNTAHSIAMAVLTNCLCLSDLVAATHAEQPRQA